MMIVITLLIFFTSRSTLHLSQNLMWFVMVGKEGRVWPLLLLPQLW